MDPQDTIPAVPTIAKSWWHARIAKWLDVRSFLWQRHQILRRPECIFEDHKNETRWKRSYDFAVSASLLSLIIIGLIASLTSFFLRDPTLRNPLADIDPTSRHLLEVAERSKAAVERSNQRFFKDHTGVYTRAQEIEFLNEQISLAKRGERQAEVLPALFNPPLWVILLFIGATPLAVYMMAQTFTLLFRMLGGSRAEKASFAPETFLYCYSAWMFWPFTIWVVFSFLWWELGKYLFLPALLNGNEEKAYSYLGIGSFVLGSIIIVCYILIVIFFLRCVSIVKRLVGLAGALAYVRLGVSMFIAAQVALLVSQSVGFGAVKALDLVQNAQWTARDYVSPEH